MACVDLTTLFLLFCSPRCIKGDINSEEGLQLPRKNPEFCRFFTAMEKLVNPYDKESMKMAMLKHEETFRYQVLGCLFMVCFSLLR